MDDTSVTSLHVREIKNIDELNSIRDEWAELYSASLNAVPFLSPAWVMPWWKYFGNNQLWTLAVYNRRILVGLAPMYIYNYKSQNGYLRQVTFLGTGNTDSMDILCRKDFEEESVKLTMDFLTGCKDCWDVCDFQELRSSSPILKIKAPEGFEVAIQNSGVRPVVKLPANFHEYLSMLPVSFRKNTLRARRQLTDSGTISLHLATEEYLEEYTGWLFRLHNASRQFRNTPGLFEDNTLQYFHKEVSKEFFLIGILRLYVLKHNERIIAAVYSFIKNKRLYYYIGGFEPEMAKYSPGSVILLEIIEKAITEGVREFDFLRGREDYKYKWNAEDRNNYRLFIRKISTSLK
ncbi:MAG: GNAT family N-acetyltransferase [Syntrophomonadaceae bacterium]